MFEISEKPMLGGDAVYLIRIRESGKARLPELRLKLAAEQHSLRVARRCLLKLPRRTMSAGIHSA